jgi:hypothetical protein
MDPATPAEASAIVPTPLGAVSICVTGGAGIIIEVEPVPVPRLPEGMVVDGVTLVRVRIEGGVRRDFALNLRVTADLEGDPESGEWLDSVAYPGRAGTFQVAVRDNEWLEAKGIISEPVVYERHGLRQTVNEAPAGASLHVSVAWRSIEGDRPSTDLSTWFAADLALPG